MNTTVFTRKLKNGVIYLKNYGVRRFFRKLKYKLKENREENTRIITTGVAEESAISDATALATLDKTIAVHIHLFYEDLLDEFISHLNNMPFAFDLYISCQESADISHIRECVSAIKCVQNVNVKAVPNRGRDIAPLFVTFGDEIAKYDYFLHIHSKKSFHSGEEQASWRQYSLDSLLGSEKLICKIFCFLEKDARVGVVFPEDHGEAPSFAYSWLKNKELGREFLEQIGVPFIDGIFTYPLGSFYWARTDALRPLFDAHLKITDFSEEAGQTDGTLAHVIERAIYPVCVNAGYECLAIDCEEDKARYGFSNKAFRKELGRTPDDLFEYLNQFDVISFDIFDTLLAREILHPDDLFSFMGKIIQDKYGIKIDYLKCRKEAERLDSSIHDIYAQLPKVMNVTEAQAKEIKELEISLEKKILIPRADMIELINRLKAQNKTIIAVSDMYLTKEILSEILVDAGYPLFDEIYVSCDCGYRKDTDEIWDYVLPKYERLTFVHVGDNMQSDCQNVCDRGLPWAWIPSGNDLSMLSGNQLFAGNQQGAIRNSISLGLTINKAIFNSPFALQNGHIQFETPYEFGYAVFGPFLYEFVKWVQNTTPSDAHLLFLAREGYIFQQIYKIIYEGKGEKENAYFLASRRAASVAGIRTWEDVREIIKIEYRGKLADMCMTRLGLAVSQEDGNIYVDISPEDLSQVDEIMKVLEGYQEQIFGQAETERKAYLTYVRSVVPEDAWENCYVVDVGYSGTIQYFLAKVMDCKIGGCYLAMFGEAKPENIGCECHTMYRGREGFSDEIYRTQLFLEAILQAPFGQLICFNQATGTEAPDAQAVSNVNPIYKKQEVVSPEIQSLQQGILAYCKDRRALVDLLNDEDQPDLQCMETIYQTLVNGIYMTEDLASIFKVEDDYCLNTYLIFDKDLNDWRL